MPLESYYLPPAVLGFACQFPREQMLGRVGYAGCSLGFRADAVHVGGGDSAQKSPRSWCCCHGPGGGCGGAGPATQCADAGPARSGPTQKEPRTQAGCRRHCTLGSSDLGLGPPCSGTGSEPGSALTRPRDSCWRVSALCARHRGGRGLFLRGQRPLGSMRPQRRLCRRRGPGRRAPCRGSRRRSRLRLRAPPPGASVQHLGQRAEGGRERAGPADRSGHCRLKAGTTECDFALLCRSH